MNEQHPDDAIPADAALVLRLATALCENDSLVWRQSLDALVEREHAKRVLACACSLLAAMAQGLANAKGGDPVIYLDAVVLDLMDQDDIWRNSKGD